MTTKRLRVRIVAAILFALLTASVASQVLPVPSAFGGVAYADECSDSGCG